MPDTSSPVDDQQDGWRCPISGECSSSKIHRRCMSIVCKGDHCWDCCAAAGCGCDIDCPEPSMDSIDYDLPPGESLTMTPAKGSTEMNTVIDGVRWRLRFRHTRKPPTTGKHGTTQCWIEVYEKHVELEGWFSVAGAYGETTCGRRDNFTRETGRQFSMVRALRGLIMKINDDGKTYKDVAAALILAYVKSSPKKERVLCDDLLHRGFHSLYNAVFDPDKLWDWHASNKLTLEAGISSWPWCAACNSYHHPDNPTCFLLTHQRNPVDQIDSREMEA